MSEENMKLWRAVEATNPDHTKKVTFGRAITAIDPYRQVEAATKQFGPAGDGWGWEVKEVKEVHATNQIAILISLWHGGNPTARRIEQWGQNGIYIDNACKKKDEDCFKKATTDGITKCLSYLGFNSDVFFGKFDDNKYVQAMNQKFAEQNQKEKEADKPASKPSPFLINIRKCDTMADLAAAHKKITDAKGWGKKGSDESKELLEAFKYQKKHLAADDSLTEVK